MTKTYPWTFDKWRRGECSEVKHLDPEDIPEYQSTYVYQFNYLKDRGWRFFQGRWVSPHNGKSYGKIYLAYGSQRYMETISESSD